MEQSKRIKAHQLATELGASIYGFINYQDRNKENVMALGVLGLSIGEQLTKLAGMECKAATGNSGALSFGLVMDAQENAMVSLMLNNLRRKAEGLVGVKTDNQMLLDLTINQFEKFESKIAMVTTKTDKELLIYGIMGTLAWVLLNWDSREEHIADAASFTLPSMKEGFLG